MTIVNGNLSTGNVNQTNRRFDFTPTVFLKKPDQAPFTALLTAMKATSSGDPKFTWFNRGQRPDQTAINNGAGYTDSATSIVVDDASIFIAGDILAVVDNTTGLYTERMEVTAVVVATNTLTVVRGACGTTAVAVVDDQVIVTIASAFAENAGAPASSVVKLDDFYNYTQIFKITHEVSRTFMETQYYAGNGNDELHKRRKEKTDDFRRQIETALIWGTRYGENLTTNSPRRFTGGLQSFIDLAVAAGQDNTFAVSGGGALTEAVWQNFLGDSAFQSGSKEKWALCSTNAINVMNQLQAGKVQLGNFETAFGMNIVRYESSHGILNLVRHDLFDKGAYANAMMIIDPDNLEIRHVGKAMTTFQTDIGLESVDGGTDIWMGELGLQVMVPESLALITNIVSAA